MIVDKQCTQQVLGCLMKHPQYLAEVDKYNFVLSDFPSRFEKYIFSAIQGLYYGGATTIGAIDIENYLSTDSVAKKTFEIQNGIEYLSDIEDFTNEDNFPYYYNKLKKLNLLKDLKKQGFDISDFYVEDLTSVQAQEVNAYFERLSASEIIDEVKKKLIKLETTYAKSEEVKVENLADTIDEFMEELEESCDIGLPVQGRIYNEIISGAVKGTLTIRSGSSGLGKTRSAVGDACLLAYPVRYNSTSCKWEQVGSCEKVLFIITEQSFKEIKKMILAYLTDINESRFKYKDFTDREEKVIQ
jgi:replicative DNA helicase